MNDINWHNLNDDESWVLLSAHPNDMVLVETTITYRLDTARNIEDWPSGPRLVSADEGAIRFAFVA